MIIQGFTIDKTIPSDWWVMAYYNVRSEEDLEDVGNALKTVGLDKELIIDAIRVLSTPNSGYTLTINKLSTSIVVLSTATNRKEFFDTFAHELKHLTEHIGSAFGFDSESEDSAWLQGEISGCMYKVIRTLMCKNNGQYIGNIARSRHPDDNSNSVLAFSEKEIPRRG